MSLNKKSTPMTKEQFYKWLRNWYSTTEKTITEMGSYGGTAYIYIKDREDIFHLNADTTREGVEEYLKLLDISSTTL